MAWFQLIVGFSAGFLICLTTIAIPNYERAQRWRKLALQRINLRANYPQKDSRMHTATNNPLQPEIEGTAMDRTIHRLERVRRAGGGKFRV